MDYAGIIIGLGNFGNKYTNTRHNIGFSFVDTLLDKCMKNGHVEKLSGQKFKCELWKCFIAEDKKQWLVAKPLTFMNLSGDSVQPLLAWHKINEEQLIVIHDELDLDKGCVRFKFGGGNAGHNGLKSISQNLGTPEFYRVRIGIGRPSDNRDVSSWVLGHIEQHEIPYFEHGLDNAYKTLITFMQKGLHSAKIYANQLSKEPLSPDKQL